MGWKKIGGPAHSLAVFGNNLAALTPDRKKVFLRDPAVATWTEIGGPAAALVGGAWDLYALTPDASEVWRYDGANWTKIGGPGAQFVGICNALYALTPDRSKVVRFDRYSGQWATDRRSHRRPRHGWLEALRHVSPRRPGSGNTPPSDGAWVKIGEPGGDVGRRRRHRVWPGAGQVRRLQVQRHARKLGKVGGPAETSSAADRSSTPTNRSAQSLALRRQPAIPGIRSAPRGRASSRRPHHLRPDPGQERGHRVARRECRGQAAAHAAVRRLQRPPRSVIASCADFWSSAWPVKPLPSSTRTSASSR